MKVILIGYRATGKSTIGLLLSRKIKVPFVDTDQLIEQAAGMPIKKIVASDGWAEFRTKETEVIASLNTTGLCVVATGGGAVLSDANRDLLKKMGILIYLKTPLHDIVERLERDAKHEQTRPQFTSGGLTAETEAILAERVPLYESVADFTVDTNGKNVVRVSEEIYQNLLEAGIVCEINKAKKKIRNQH